MALDLRGVNPANVVPMTPDGAEIDETGLREHLRDLVATDGVNGIVTNGHAGEVYALSREERARVVEIAADEADAGTPVVSGVVGGSTAEVVAGVERVHDAGADGILVVPPHTPIDGRPEAARGFFADVADASDLPLVIFQHPHWAGGHYPSDLLAELAATGGVVAVKDAVWDVDHFQDDLRALRDGDADADVQLLVGNDEHLLPSFALGTDGAVLELAAVIPELVVDLFEAVEAGEIRHARETYERMEPFVNAMYEDPLADSHTRLKVALQLQGVFESAAPRPPAAPIPEDEVADIERAMTESEVL